MFSMKLHHDHAGGTPEACSSTPVHLRGNTNIGQVLVLPHNWKVTVYLNQQCVSCQNHDLLITVVDKFLNLFHPMLNLLLLYHLLCALAELARLVAGSQKLCNEVQADQQLLAHSLLIADLLLPLRHLGNSLYL